MFNIPVMEQIEKIKEIRTWQSGGVRAPHKPLLILYVLGRISRGAPRLVPYREAKEDLRNLIREFGPVRTAYHPKYPFLRLSNDGDFWQLRGDRYLDTSTDWSERDIEDNRTSGGFSEEVYAYLKDNKVALHDLARFVLDKYFPDTLHQDIFDQVGLDLEEKGGRIRSPDFRNRVLRAYEYSCAVCGFNVRLGDTLVAVEAAHIKWHCCGGPDDEENGIALCSLHHKLFDRGAFTLDESNVLRVAESAHGTRGFDEWLMRYHNKPIRQPQRPDYYPNKGYIDWHFREVFRGPSRYGVG